MGLFDKFKIGLGKSSDGLSTGFKNIFSKKKIDENVLLEFEELIITSDAGVEVAKELRKDFENFKFYVALSEPLEEDNWKVKDGLDGEGDGFKGFVHQCVIDNYLNDHEAPEDMEVYFCGPPLMNQAIEKMADDFGIPPENVRFDDFGG